MTRKRITKTREERLRALKTSAIWTFANAAKAGTGMHEAFEVVMQECKAADLTPTQKEELTNYTWGIRDHYHQTEPHWQLFVDGVPRTSEEISAMREAGDETVWHRVKGLTVWRRHLPAMKSFYNTGEEPRKV
jgi:hypothetical protein